MFERRSEQGSSGVPVLRVLLRVKDGFIAVIDVAQITFGRSMGDLIEASRSLP